jgi:hypothetical protein
MTHSNHRRGNRESLDHDYVILVRGDTVKTDVEKARKAVRILANHNPVGLVTRRKGVPIRFMRNWDEGLTLQEVADHPDPPRYIHGVYDKTEDVHGLVQDFVDAKLGFSVVVSGVFENTFNICGEVGTGPHTANMSMETLGRTELLPEDRILEVMTMCGHSLVGEPLIRHLIGQVRKGYTTAENAGLELGKQCVCNFFNPVRAAKIIEEYASMQR